MSKTIALCLLTAVAAMAADKVWAPLPEIINIHPDYQYATARVVKSYVDAEGRYELVIPPRPTDGSAAIMPVTDSVVAQAAAQGCKYYLSSTMTRLGDNIIINFELHETSSRALIWSDRLKAASPDDIDPIAMRVGKALGTSEKAAKDDDIYSVTNFEQKNLKQKKSNNSFGVAIGGLSLPAGPFNEDAVIGGIGAVWAYDTRDILVDLEADLFLSGENTSATMAGVSVWRPVKSANITPYWGGGVGLGSVGVERTDSTSYGEETSTDSNGGLMVWAGGGLLMNRTSNVNIRLDMRYTLATFKVADKLPQGIALRVIASFGS